MRILLKSLLWSIGCVTLQTLALFAGGMRSIAVQALYYPANYLLFHWRILPVNRVTSILDQLLQWFMWFLLFLIVFAGSRALERVCRRVIRFGDYFAWFVGVQFIVLSLPWDRTYGWWTRCILFFYSPALRFDHSENVEANIGAPLRWIGPGAIVYAALLAVVITLLRQFRTAQPHAAPNGGPVASPDVTSTSGGPPSVS
jgi:hypothetical protein